MAKSTVDAKVIKCSNCEREALYTLGDTVQVINYCGVDLPQHFVDAASRGEFPLNTEQ